MQIPVIRYSRDTSDFTKTLRARVDAYFKERILSRTGDWRLHLKTALMIALYFVPWALITWGMAGSGWMFWVAEIVMGLGLAGIGLNMMHDANHDAYSDKKWVNLWVGRVLDLVGGNAAIWKIQHNVLHHTFTNVDGLDEDKEEDHAECQCELCSEDAVHLANEPAPKHRVQLPCCAAARPERRTPTEQPRLLILRRRLPVPCEHTCQSSV